MMKRFINWLTSRISPTKASHDPGLSSTGAHLRQTGSHLRQTESHLRQSGSHLRQSGGHAVPRATLPKQPMPDRQPDIVELDPRIGGRIEDNGPGKNVLVRNKYVREDTGTHETLKILDDSILDTEEEVGIDPYNTGQFDRSRNWDKRRK